MWEMSKTEGSVMAPRDGGFWRRGRRLLPATALVGGLLLSASAAYPKDGKGFPSEGRRLYAHEKINVRSGPGMGHEVIGTLLRGNAVEVGRTEGEWGEVRLREKRGYVLLKLLKPEAVPSLEIVRWDWRKAPRTGRRGVVVWVVEVRNNTERPVEHVQVEFRTFDRKGKLIERDVTHLRGIGPGKVAGSRAFATYSGREASAQVELLAEDGPAGGG